MRWRETCWDHIGDALKFLAGAGILISSILGSAFLIWLVAMLLWNLRSYLSRILFAHPW